MGVALAFAPFDVTANFGTDRLPETFAPLAAVLGLEIDKSAQELKAARPTAVHFHKEETNLNLALQVNVCIFATPTHIH